MKTCFIKLQGDKEATHVEVDTTGHGTLASGKYRYRVLSPLGKYIKYGWGRLSIGDVVEWIGSKTNCGGAVYSATIIQESNHIPRDTGGLFRGGDA